MDGWNTIVSFWDGLFAGATLVSRRVRVVFFRLRNKSFLSGGFFFKKEYDKVGDLEPSNIGPLNLTQILTHR